MQVPKSETRVMLGKTGISVPRIVYGTSYLGNLYRAVPFTEKLDLMKQWFECTGKPVVIDTAGKYGAGLALEVIGRGMELLGIAPDELVISNKLGWYRVPLASDEPTFEPGAWVGLEHDCVQRFGYQEAIECFNQGNELLGGTHSTELVSVHDPDEYLFAASSPADRDRRFGELLESYRALFDIKAEGRVKAVGIGAKEWTVIRELYQHVPFDWVMFANSYTIFDHPPEIIGFMDLLHKNGVGIINSALFHGGFLTGGTQFDYRVVDPASPEGSRIYRWREEFNQVCNAYRVKPWHACLRFGFSHPAICAVSLNTSNPLKMKLNVEALDREIPPEFWAALKDGNLIDSAYPYL
jgi:D-threo-aldose 1-dehydrogenase